MSAYRHRVEYYSSGRNLYIVDMRDDAWFPNHGRDVWVVSPKRTFHSAITVKEMSMMKLITEAAARKKCPAHFQSLDVANEISAKRFEEERTLFFDSMTMMNDLASMIEHFAEGRRRNWDGSTERQALVAAKNARELVKTGASLGISHARPEEIPLGATTAQ